MVSAATRTFAAIHETFLLKLLYSVPHRGSYGEEGNKSGYLKDLLDVVFHGTEHNFSLGTF